MTAMDRFALLARADVLRAELDEIRVRLDAEEARDRVLAKMRAELVENVQRASFPFVEQLVTMRALDASEDEIEMLKRQHKQAIGLVVDESLSRLRVSG